MVLCTQYINLIHKKYFFEMIPGNIRPLDKLVQHLIDLANSTFMIPLFHEWNPPSLKRTLV